MIVIIIITLTLSLLAIFIINEINSLVRFNFFKLIGLSDFIASDSIRAVFFAFFLPSVTLRFLNFGRSGSFKTVIDLQFASLANDCLVLLKKVENEILSFHKTENFLELHVKLLAASSLIRDYANDILLLKGKRSRAILAFRFKEVAKISCLIPALLFACCYKGVLPYDIFLEEGVSFRSFFFLYNKIKASSSDSDYAVQLALFYFLESQDLSLERLKRGVDKCFER